MECLVQVEMGEEWSGEATVKTKLIDKEYSEIDQSSETEMENVPRNFESLKMTKYILVYRHFEQLSKTTENLIQLAAIARRWERYVVQPDVQNSRFYFEPRFRAYSLDTYFNITSLNEILLANGYSQLVQLKSFSKDCNYAKFGVNTTLIHFLYSDIYRGSTKSWFGISDKKLREIVKKSLSSGWTECGFIERRLGVKKQLVGIEIGRQVCVNPEVLRSVNDFEDNVLRGDKCVIFLEWRGFGKQRTHFHPVYLPFLTPVEVKHRMSPSNLVEEEVISFVQSEMSSKYISVHIRSERFFVADLYEKLQFCLDHVLHIVRIVRALREVDTVFLATDLTDFGSDLFDRRRFYKTNATGKHLISRQDITDIHAKLARRLDALTYKPMRKPFSEDKGIFSLVEMNILKRGIDLITVGFGTFHAWTVNVFRQHQAEVGRRGYTIFEVCGNTNQSR